MVLYKNKVKHVRRKLTTTMLIIETLSLCFFSDKENLVVILKSE